MGKVRHRKQTRAARVAVTAAPLADPSDPTTNSHPNQHREGKKGARRDHEMQDLLDKLRAPEGRDRVFAASTLSSLILSLPPMQLRLLLSRNLIGLLIERLSTLSAPSLSSSSTPPPSDDLSTAIESLGALRNLAVSSPPHILSEMHNKRLLLPLATIHLPLLAHFLPHQLAPPPAPVKPALPATAEQRRAADAANEAHDTLRRSFWDWTENVLTLVWCLAESNTKILAGLNAYAEHIVALCVALLDEDRLGIDKLDGDEQRGEGAAAGGMDVEGGKALKKKDAKREKAKRLRVPLFVAVAAAQTLHAFISSNPAAHTHLLSSAGSFTFSPSLSTLLSILLTPTPPSSSSHPSTSSTDAASSSAPSSADADAWAQLRVLAFGSLLEIAKGRSKRRDVETVRDALRSDVAQGVLLGLVGSARLEDAVGEAKKVAGEIDPTALPNQHTTAPDSPAGKLAALERQSQTLQLALEVLSEWLASGLPAAGSFDGAAGSGAEGEDEGEDEEEQEAWGGISMEVEGGDDIDMGASDGEGEDEAMGGDQVNEADGVIRRRRGDTPTADDSMLDDLAATAGDGDDSDSDSDDDSAVDASATKSGALALLSSLPLQLLALSRPTSLSFLSPSSFAPSPLDSPASASATSSSGLISTSAASADLVPHNLAPLAEALTTVHVRATEALNNLYVVLSRAGAAKGAAAATASRRDAKELQSVFESALQLMLGALEGARAYSAATPAATAAASSGKKGKGGDKAPQQQGGDEVDEVQERRLEVVMAAAGVVWGCVRLGLDPEHGAGLVVGPDTTPFLIQRVYASPFAAEPTPSGEAIRVRTLGALGYLGRRKGVPAEENAQIGRFLLSLLPSRTASTSASTSPSTVASTPDILLQDIDSLIDLYADEEREYDVPVFREGGMLQALEGSVPGVRAAIKKVDRNKFPELRSRADGALENLVAFVGYRKDVVKQRR
ncbi:hypothetical protein JCM9279_001204 [Rhodotorula babjevae]